jgi:hypothetical protein
MKLLQLVFLVFIALSLNHSKAQAMEVEEGDSSCLPCLLPPWDAWRDSSSVTRTLPIVIPSLHTPPLPIAFAQQDLTFRNSFVTSQYNGCADDDDNKPRNVTFKYFFPEPSLEWQKELPPYVEKDLTPTEAASLLRTEDQKLLHHAIDLLQTQHYTWKKANCTKLWMRILHAALKNTSPEEVIAKRVCLPQKIRKLFTKLCNGKIKANSCVRGIYAYFKKKNP